MEAGQDVPDSAVEDQIRQMAPNKACTLIYTVSHRKSIHKICNMLWIKSVMCNG